MGAVALSNEAVDDKCREMQEYLSEEGGYWLKEDKWIVSAGAFAQAGINTGRVKKGIIADFTGYSNTLLKTEVKYFVAHALKDRRMSASNIYVHYKNVISEMGVLLNDCISLGWLDNGNKEIWGKEWPQEHMRLYLTFKKDAIRYLTDFYDERDEFEKDVWQARRIPGCRQSAAGKRTNPSISFGEIPVYYRGMVKRFMARLVVRRSWSYSSEMLVYIKYFFRVFYEDGYTDGFFRKMKRMDMEKYLGWVAADYAERNATYRSKAVSYIRQFLDYIQLAEYPEAPEKDATGLIFDDDIPRRERAEDTLSKVKYIPLPVREQLDASLQELEPEEMRPVYVLLRETGWRGTDVLNLRYDSCLDYIWNSREQDYIPYLCGEITKTGIPMLKIPIRREVADMVKGLAESVRIQSTEENNPDHYLFNTFSGKNMGLPYSKPAFSRAVQELINRKGILDADGKPYHFKAHSLRHTRAMEYTEQGMPIGIIQQVLGHCSLQMTLHYAKVSENMLYEKWKETEKLDLLHVDTAPPQDTVGREEGLHYEYVRQNLDAVKVPFGVCFSPSALHCRHQENPCLDCVNFCSCTDHIREYEEEIRRLHAQIELSRKLGRDEWERKNTARLEQMEAMLARIKDEGVVHKNDRFREVRNG